MPNKMAWLIASLIMATPRNTKNKPGKQHVTAAKIAMVRSHEGSKSAIKLLGTIGPQSTELWAPMTRFFTG